MSEQLLSSVNSDYNNDLHNWAEIERQVRENADKLLPGAARRAAAKPKAVEEAPVAPAPAAADAAPAAAAEKATKPAGRAANIDIAVED